MNPERMKQRNKAVPAAIMRRGDESVALAAAIC